MRFIIRLVQVNLLHLRRRLFLLGVIAAAFVMLSVPLGEGMQTLLSREDHSGMTIAVAGKNGEGEKLASFAGNLPDIASYCRFLAAEESEAMELLAQGRVTAVLVLPDHFVDSILTGRNENAVLYLDGAHPAESLLTLYVGQCAADMLSAAQGGIYAVLDALDASGTVRENAVYEINMEYIRFTMSRGNMYEAETVSAAGELPLPLHYMRSVLAWLMTAAGVLFCPVFGGQKGWRCRLKSAGCTGAQWALGTEAALLLCYAVLTGALCLAGGSFALTGWICCTLFACGLGCAVGVACPGEVSAAAVSFLLSTALAFFSGGIIPPMLLPAALRSSALYTAASALRRCMGGSGSVGLCLTGAVLLLLSGAALACRFERGAER